MSIFASLRNIHKKDIYHFMKAFTTSLNSTALFTRYLLPITRYFCQAAAGVMKDEKVMTSLPRKARRILFNALFCN